LNASHTPKTECNKSQGLKEINFRCAMRTIFTLFITSRLIQLTTFSSQLTCWKSVKRTR